MELSANELRIGNWINFGDKLNNLQINGTLIADFEERPYEFDYLSPIFLTEEWLLMFGFEKQKTFYVRGEHCELFSGLMKFKFNRLLQKWVFNIGTYRDLTRIQYVHQLQNLYWCLCGEELELK